MAAIMPRLALAFVASLMLHLGVLAVIDGFSHRGRPSPPRPTPAMLDAVLVPPTRPPEPVLKDTLAEATAAKKARQTEARPRDPRAPRTASTAAQRKLAEHLFYPPEAIARGLEGEVRLLLTLAADGTVEDATVAAGSGHAILDQAAVRAAWAMGRLPGAAAREVILPVVFRLRP